MKVAFFDRDGTIIEDYPDKEWSSIKHPLFLDGAIDTLKEVVDKKYQIIIITNQYIINDGYITLNQYHSLNKQMLHELKNHNIEIHDIFYCPHSEREGCSCMKPRDGMIKSALEKYPTINLADSFLIGDSPVDLELAVSMKIKGYGIGLGADYQTENIVQLNDIKELTKFI
ncbi:HAD-IIIA family hydrolase [Gracilibacillus caseinilyticus]|uniref:D,D-heptose 1,7-bisphosphate phosphatase n=1 Tax=Gracilibacillus caseinilyticus TaxID=2932256 RepID=A0ABY4EXH3_9BACI|nr:HAD-IIIA family hydrolase [Gracilibacillus caseinilyticus]UOQ46856.1 HAD-IIIA family hydrolase [Gracilibacillus caseinilyticus]